MLVCHPGGPGGSALILDDLGGLDRDLTLIELSPRGHSAGGFVSMVYASAYPHRVARLVLCGTFTRFTDDWRRQFERFLGERDAEGATFHVPALRYFNERVAPTFDLRPQLSRIEAPTLVLTGELDVWAAGAAPELESHLADAKVAVLPGVGHMPWVEDPDAFRRELLAFLA